MRSVNKVILVGNLTRDPELKTTTNGQSIVTFGLATNRQWTTSNGEKKDSAEFHECVAWAKLAEICKTYLKKGMLVYVEGYLKTRSWDLEDGTRRFRTEIVLQDMIMLEKRGSDGEYVPAPNQPTTSEVKEVTQAPAETTESAEVAHATETASVEATPSTEEAAPAETAKPEETPTSAPGAISADIDDDNMF